MLNFNAKFNDFHVSWTKLKISLRLSFRFMDYEILVTFSLQYGRNENIIITLYDDRLRFCDNFIFVLCSSMYNLMI